MDDSSAATKKDLSREATLLRSEAKTATEEIRADVDDLRSDLKAEIWGATVGLRDELRSMEQRMDTKLETSLATMRDEIIRAFGMTEEDIGKEAAHRDEMAATNNRVARIEEHFGFNRME